MRVHHLDCGPLAPSLGALGLAPRRLCCHVLALETAAGVVLVDAGFGRADLASPASARARLGAPFVALAGPALDEKHAARAQLEGLGLRARDVRHVVLTHLDLDHAGGIADFPAAEVHVMAEEHAVATAQRRLADRMRYRAAHFAHRPSWALHATAGERWLGFDSVRAIPGLGDDVLLVPLPGHTKGHAAVAVRSGDGWLLHAGDAYMHRAQLDGGRVPLAIRIVQRLDDVDARARRRNLVRLRALATLHGDEVRIFSAHDPVELAHAVEAAARATVSSTAGRAAQ